MFTSTLIGLLSDPGVVRIRPGNILSAYNAMPMIAAIAIIATIMVIADDDAFVSRSTMVVIKIGVRNKRNKARRIGDDSPNSLLPKEGCEIILLAY